MTVKIINRKYRIGGKWYRFEILRGVYNIGFKFCFGKYEVRFYNVFKINN